MIGNEIKNKGLTINSAMVMVLFLIVHTLPAIPLQGIVTDSLGSGQAGATVELYEPKMGVLAYSIQTDASGYFQFTEVSEMDYQIRVLPQSYPVQWFSFIGNTMYRQKSRNNVRKN